MAYIEDRIDCLEDRLCKLERQLENQHLEDRVSTLEDIIETDGEKLDRLSERVEQKPQVQQTTEELVKVVRCENCRYYMEYHELNPHCYQDGRETNSNDFCSWGAIKEKNMSEVTG